MSRDSGNSLTDCFKSVGELRVEFPDLLDIPNVEIFHAQLAQSKSRGTAALGCADRSLMTPYLTDAAIVIGAWIAASIIGQAIKNFAQTYAKNRPAAPAQVVPAVSNVAATLIAAAMNNPRYIERMDTLRRDLKDAWDSKPLGIKEIFGAPEDHQRFEQERAAAEKRIKACERDIYECDLLKAGHRPYIDLALEIYRSVCELERKGTTFCDLDCQRAMNSSAEVAEQIERTKLLRELTRP